MRVELCDCQNVLLEEIADKHFTQKSVALTYAMAMESSERVDWYVVNQAIIKRWSESGLERVKRMAWAKREGKK